MTLLFCASYPLPKRYICDMPAAAKRSLFIVNFITGLSDGLKLPLVACLIALFVFTGDERWKAILAGIAVSALGALVFGLARFLGEKEEIHHHHPRLAAKEAEKEAALMQAIDIDKTLSEAMLRQMEAEKEQWLKEIKENELDWERYDPKRARESGLHTAGGFLAGGLLICLTFYLFCIVYLQSPLIASLVSLIACYGFGWYKGRLLDHNAVSSGMLELGRGFTVVMAALVILLLLYVKQGGFAASIFGLAPTQP